MVSTVLTVALANISITLNNGDEGVVFPAVAVALTALLAGIGGRLFLNFLMIVVLLRNAYGNANEIEDRLQRQEQAQTESSGG